MLQGLYMAYQEISIEERYHQGRQLKLLEFAEFAEFAEFSGVTMGL